MSTLTMPMADIASSDAFSAPQPGLFGRLITLREASARRHTLSFLAAQSDERLEGLGFSAGDIRALRSGELRLPAAR